MTVFREPSITAEQLAEMQKTNIDLTRELDEKNKKIAELEAESGFFGGRRAVKEVRAEMDRLRGEAELASNNHIAEIAMLEQRHARELAAAKSRLLNMQEEHTRTKERLSDEINRLKTELATVRKRENADSLPTSGEDGGSKQKKRYLFFCAQAKAVHGFSGVQDRLNEHAAQGYKVVQILHETTRGEQYFNVFMETDE